MRLHLPWWNNLPWVFCAGYMWSMLSYGGGPHSDKERLPTGKATVLDQLPQLHLGHPRVVVGNRNRLRDVAGLDRSNWLKLAQPLLNLTTASGEIEPFDWHRHRFHVFLLTQSWYRLIAH